MYRFRSGARKENSREEVIKKKSKGSEPTEGSAVSQREGQKLIDSGLP